MNTNEIYKQTLNEVVNFIKSNGNVDEIMLARKVSKNFGFKSSRLPAVFFEAAHETADYYYNSLAP